MYMQYETVEDRREVYKAVLTRIRQYSGGFICLAIGHFTDEWDADLKPLAFPEFYAFKPIDHDDDKAGGWFNESREIDKAHRVDVLEAAILICDLIINADK